MTNYWPIAMQPTSQQRATAAAVADWFDTVVNTILVLSVLTLGVLLW